MRNSKSNGELKALIREGEFRWLRLILWANFLGGAALLAIGAGEPAGILWSAALVLWIARACRRAERKRKLKGEALWPAADKVRDWWHTKSDTITRSSGLSSGGLSSASSDLDTLRIMRSKYPASSPAYMALSDVIDVIELGQGSAQEARRA